MLLEYVSGGRVAVVTLNRPHADNAITTELAAALIEILETVAARTSVRVAILTGAGDRAFSVGGDLRQRKAMTKEQWLRQRQVFDRILYTLRQLRRPVIAACTAWRTAAVCEIAIARTCASSRQTTPGSVSPKRSWACQPGAERQSFFQSPAPGHGAADLMTGDPITAQEAHRLGMVTELHPRAELMPAALRIADAIASNSPTAVQAVKQAVRLEPGRSRSSRRSRS